MKIAFTPVGYEHAARFVGRTPWQVSRDADLMFHGHRLAYLEYRHQVIAGGHCDEQDLAPVLAEVLRRLVLQLRKGVCEQRGAIRRRTARLSERAGAAASMAVAKRPSAAARTDVLIKRSSRAKH